MSRARIAALLVPIGVIGVALRAGATEYIIGDSERSGGPPYAMLDLSAEAPLDLGGAEELSRALPFAFDWHGASYTEARAGADAVLLFGEAGDPGSPSCPGDGGEWSGVAALWGDLGEGELRERTVGRYPYRAYALDWRAPDAVAGGEGHVQLWLLEGRAEAVVVLADLRFSEESGDTSADGGAAAVVGVQGPEGAVAWSCEGGLVEGSTAWFGPADARPSAPERSSGELDAWNGYSTFQYAGRTLAAADLQGDGWSDLVIGDQDQDRVYVVSGGPEARGGSLEGAASALVGEDGDELGAALALGDLDGDGALELALGAPSSDTAGSGAGAVHLVSAAALPVALSLPDDADLALWGPSSGGRPSAGSALAAADLDGDGYVDLAVGAPRADLGATDAGAVYLWAGGADVLAGSASLSDAAGVVRGEAASDQAGRALAAGDLDGDGAHELLVGAPYADASTSATNAGRLYLLPGGAIVDGGAADLATLTITGSAADDRLGLAMAIGDPDADGAADLVVGAPYVDGGAASSGAVYLFLDAAARAGALGPAEADASVLGTETSANLGAALAVADLDADGRDDLVLAAPNATGDASDAGVVGVFTAMEAGEWTLEDAGHRLVGSDSAGAAGTALAVAADHDGDGFADLVAGAPYASPGGISRAGSVHVWSFVPSFVDADADGFVGTAAGGLDCDDDEEGVNPNAAELDGTGVDEDCDGWVDGFAVARAVEGWWRWDLEAELGEVEPASFDFEDARAGEEVDELYLDDAVYFAPDGDLTATTLVWGALPEGELGARLLAGLGGNGLTILFGAEVEAVALQILDGEAPFLLDAAAGGEALLEGLVFEAAGADRTGGAFAGFTFASSIDELRVQSTTDDAWGIDQLRVVWAADTDRDGDGWTENGGDCEDADAAVSPDAAEILGNGLDDDCDGVIDGGGLALYEDEESWEVALGETPERIDFEALVEGERVAEQYVSLGVSFEGEVSASGDLDGSAPLGELGAGWEEGALRVEFEELQPGVAFAALDVAGGLSLVGEVDGEVVYELDLALDSEDLDGGGFVGLIFDYGVDALEIRAASTLDDVGLDELRFAPLGLDDADGDGFTEREGDCDDGEAEAHPGGEETYYDGVDGDCDGASDYDADLDGYDDARGGGVDCDDGAADTHPDAEETYYDGVDADCDGLSDYDADGDGHDDEDWGGDDCDDGDAAVSPEAEETYYDGVDADCDGASDYDADGDGFVPSIFGGAVAGDDSVTVGDCDDAEGAVFPGAEDESYDGVDADCGEDSDYDADGDGHDALDWGGDDCDDTDELAYPGSTWERCYDGQDSDCAGDEDWDCDRDGYALEGHGGEDCDDADAEIHPGAPDAPRDGVDGDCDGALEFDDDGDGWDGAEDGGEDCDDADPAVNPGAEDACYDGLDADCDGASDDDCDGDGWDADAAGGADCDDADATIHPEAVDYYYDGIDNDCDGDEDFDADGDGWPADWYGGTDCDDTDPAVFPGAEETWYDGVDADCAGDDDDDADGDGAGAAARGGADCDDADPAVGPAAEEIPLDGTDQDCDGVDDVDEDGDGAWSAEDCDDADPGASPGAEELCWDGVDQDCDGADTVDCDGDGHDTEALGGTDCEDTDPAVFPGAEETWYDGVDADCAGDSDYDQDGDGHDIDALGGTDCDDTDARTSPDRLLDDCGGGDEDCDGAADEDCPEAEAGLPDEAGAPDTAEPTPEGEEGEDDSGASGQDTAQAVGPGETRPPSEQILAQGCGCASAGRAGGLLGLALIGLALGVRRQR